MMFTAFADRIEAKNKIIYADRLALFVEKKNKLKNFKN